MVSNLRPGHVLPVLVLLLSLAFAGCVAEPQATDESTSDPGARLRAGPAVSVDTECPCFEPNVAVGPDGWTYATAAAKGALLVSRDGATFETIPAPGIPLTAPPDTRQNDAMVQTDAEGGLHYHALITRYYSSPLGIGGVILYGIQYAHSGDHGATWDVNVYLAFPEAQDLPQLGADRQWLTIADDGTLYLTYQQIPPILGPIPQTGQDPRGLRIASSEDGGRSWSAFQSITGDDRVMVINGQPLTDGNGTLFVPFFSYSTPARLEVAVSTDRGQTFERHSVYQPDEGYPGAWFPSLTTDTDGRLIMVWHGPGELLQVASSSDRAQTWSEPHVWNITGNTSATSPWAFVDGEHLLVLWYEKTGDDTARLLASRTPLADLSASSETIVVVEQVQGSGFRPANTDFAHGTATPDGTIRAIWGTSDGTWIADLAVR